jgi:hypothetical protein
VTSFSDNTNVVIEGKGVPDMTRNEAWVPQQHRRIENQFAD